LKKRGVLRPFLDDFWLIWGPFGGQKWSKTPSKKGSIFQGKKGCPKKRKKARPRGYGNHWPEYFGGPGLPYGSKIHDPMD